MVKFIYEKPMFKMDKSWFKPKWKLCLMSLLFWKYKKIKLPDGFALFKKK